MKRYKVYTKEKGLIATNDYNDFVGLTLHREDCPAYIEYDISGNIETTGYYIENIQYTKCDYDRELMKRKVNLL